MTVQLDLCNAEHHDHLGSLHVRCILDAHHGRRPHWGPRSDDRTRFVEWPQERNNR